MSNMYPNNAHSANRSGSSPRYFIETRRGMRPYMPSGGDAPFAVMHRGRWCLVYRGCADAEYFADHPEAAWRFTVRRHSRDYFEFRIITRDGGTIADGDRWDVYGKLDHASGGTPRERLRAAAEQLLVDPNRAYPAVWVA